MTSDSNHSTSLLLGAKYGHTAIVSMLIEYCNPSNIADLIEVAESDTGMTPLMYASLNCDPVMVRILLRAARSAGLDVEKLVSATNFYGVNSMMFACSAVPVLGLVGEDAGLVEFTDADSAAADADVSLRSDALDELDEQAGGRKKPGIRMERIPSLKVMVSGQEDNTKPSLVSLDAEKQKKAAGWRASALSALRRAERVLNLLLGAVGKPDRNVDLLRKTDIQGWSAFHYASRSGLLGYLDWRWLLKGQVKNVPVKLANAYGATMLHLVSGEWS